MQDSFTDFAAIFVYLGEAPLLWLTLTLGAFLAAEQLYQFSNRFALLNPVLVSSMAICIVLYGTGTPYDAYFRGAQFIHFLLGPAIIVLAVPVWRHRAALWRARFAVLIALIVGGRVAGLSVIGLSVFFELDLEMAAAITPKSVTAPVAMGIAENLGGAVSLAALLAVLTGISGVVLATPLFNAFGFLDWRGRGFAVGITCHGIGTAHAFQLSSVAGSFATFGMALNALFSAVILPVLFLLIYGEVLFAAWLAS